MRVFSRVLVLTLPLAASCVGSSAPNVTPRSTLSLGADTPRWREDGPFVVSNVTPTGPVRGEVELSVTFSRPLRALGADATPPAPPVTISPAVEGTWQWLGSRAVRFVPKAKLPSGTEFTVEVPKGVRAVDGSTLDAGWRGSFTTAAPEVSITPYDRSAGLARDAVIYLAFSQPVALDEVRRRARVVDQAGAVVAVTFAADAKATNTYVLTPTSPLAPASRFEVHVDGSLRGVEGPRPMGKDVVSSFDTYGPLEPVLSCSRDTAERCRPRGYFEVSFNNVVRARDAKEAIRVEPAVPLRWHGGADDAPTRSVSFSGEFRAGATYTILVGTKTTKGKQLIDGFGQGLQGERRLTLPVADHEPAIEVGFRGVYLEPKLLADIPIYATNVQGLVIDAAPVGLAAAIAIDAGRPGAVEAALATPGAVHLTPASAGRNRLGKTLVPVTKLVGPAERGLVVFKARYPGDRREVSEQALVQVTDLGLTAKLDGTTAVVWVTRLSSGKPVPGAKVTVSGVDGHEGEAVETDAAGFARAPLPPRTAADGAVAVVAREGADLSFRRITQTMSGWRFGVSACPSCSAVRTLLFTDRGLYRPGDKVQVKGIVRDTDASGLVVPAGRRLTAKLAGPEGEAIASFDVTLSSSGSFSTELTVPATGKLGTYVIELRDGEREWGSESFQVAEFRPTELEVSAEFDRRDYVRGDLVRCEGKGKYLFGAPMAGASTRMTLTRARAWFSPPGFPDHVFDDDLWLSAHRETAPSTTTLGAREDKLDARGVAMVSAKADAPQSGAETVTCEAEITDLSRQTLTGSATAFVHPGDFYLGVRLGGEGFARAGTPIRGEVLAVDPQGKRRGGVPVQLELLRRVWKVAYLDAGGGRHHAEWTSVDTSVGSCHVTTGATTPGACELSPRESGFHVLRATAADGRKNPLAASTGVYALGDGAPTWPDTDDLSLSLVPDKKSYKVGDVAKILVKSPFAEAEAWITVEREGVMSSERRTLSGASPTLQIPVTDALVPNAFVSVSLVRGRTKAPPPGVKRADVGAPAFRMGVVPLVVDHAARRLSVTVAPDRTEHLPGEKVAVSVDVRDHEGKPAPAEITLYAVDEGVLSLGGYQTPDPVALFFAPRPLRVETLESREDLARVARAPGFLGPGLDKGLDGGSGGLSVRRDFRQTAVFLPSLHAGADGKATASFQLPDGLTSYRVMAVAVSGADRFGSGDARITTSKPLMARPALPRFLRAGDSFEASVLVTSKGVAPGRVSVQLAEDGLVPTGPKSAEVELGEGETKEVRFPLEARAVGRAKLRFSAEGAGLRDAVEVSREISSPARLESAAVFGSTEDAAGEALGDLSAARADVGGLQVTLSPTALAALGGGLEQLVEYPYGCTEQLTSRLVPLLPLRDLAKALKVTLPSDLDQAVVKTVAKLQDNQQSNGGFGLWPESVETPSWLTAYALWGLVAARDHGVAVRESTIAAAKLLLERRLDDDVDHDPVSSVFVVDALGEAGAPKPGIVTRLFEARRDLSTSSKAMLLTAAIKAQSPMELRDALVSEIAQEVRLDGASARVVSREDGWRVLDSDTRASALVLRALVRESPKHPLVPKLAAGLVAARRGGRWRTTQEAAWALLALDEYRRVVESGEPSMDARYFLGGATIAETRLDGLAAAFSLATPMSSLRDAGGSVLAFEKRGSGRLYYEARLRFAPKEPRRKPVDAGFWVEKSLVPVSVEALGAALRSPPSELATRVSAGKLVLVTLTVVAPSPREYVVLDDPLPAGLEAVDASLRGAGSIADLDSRRDERPGEDDELEAPLTRKEVRDDRVVFFVDDLPAGVHRYRYLARATTIGRFAMPPTRVDEMYVPETFGETAAATLEITP